MIYGDNSKWRNMLWDSIMVDALEPVEIRFVKRVLIPNPIRSCCCVAGFGLSHVASPTFLLPHHCAPSAHFKMGLGIICAARKFNYVNPKTVIKWRKRQEVEDPSNGPKRIKSAQRNLQLLAPSAK
ncbi:hypothetical protein MIDIC_500023 [Alphaproteobacteria bacterium]